LKFAFIIVDKINDQSNTDTNGFDSNNQQEVLSDTLQIVNDTVQWLFSLAQYGIILDTEQDIQIEQLLDETTDKVSGWLFNVELKIKHTNCSLPMSGSQVPGLVSNCPNVIVKNSDGTYSVSVSSGDVLTLPDNTVDINDSIYTIPAQTPTDVNITVDNQPPTNLTIVDNGNTFDIDVTTPKTYGFIYKTMTSHSQFPNDDFDTQRGIDHFSIPFKNHFGTYDRFTDVLGGQTYANDVVLDWSTYDGVKVLGYNRIIEPPRNLSTHLSLTPAFRNGYNNWFVANARELLSIYKFTEGAYPTGQGVGAAFSPFNYAPFNISLTSSERMWSSTSRNGSIYFLVTGNGTFSLNNAVGVYNTILVRYFDVATEL
jgi:hypothetical protein